MEILKVDIVYKKEIVIQLEAWEKLFLHRVQFYDASSTCSKSMKPASTKRILAFHMIINLQKLQWSRPTWSVKCKILRLVRLRTCFERVKAMQRHRHAGQTIHLREENGDCCASASLERDYSKHGNIRRNIPSLPRGSCSEATNSPRVFRRRIWAKCFAQVTFIW